MVALARVVFTSREHVITLEPRGKGLLGMTLRYPYEVRKEDEFFDDIEDEKIPKDSAEGVAEKEAVWREDRSAETARTSESHQSHAPGLGSCTPRAEGRQPADGSQAVGRLPALRLIASALWASA